MAVTVELTIGRVFDFHGDSVGCQGRYSYNRSGKPLSLCSEGFSPTTPLVLQETQYLDEQALTGRWHAAQPVGPLLSGTWTSADGKRQLPFELRESYADAIRYEVLTASATGRICDPEDTLGGVNGPNSILTRDYLHLLSPATVRLGLRRLQCPTPARRRAQLRRDARQEECVYLTENVNVDLNGYGLLSIWRGRDEEGFGHLHPYYSWRNTVYDLHTGQALRLSDLLRPQTDSLLLCLIMPRLERYLADFYDRKISKLDQEPGLPESGFSLTSEGILFMYGESDGVASWPCIEQSVVIPYRELLPLLRAHSPLAALLQDRGLRAVP